MPEGHHRLRAMGMTHGSKGLGSYGAVRFLALCVEIRIKLPNFAAFFTISPRNKYDFS